MYRRTLGAVGKGTQLLATSKKWAASGANPIVVQAKTALVMHAQKLKSPGYNSLEHLLELVNNLDKAVLVWEQKVEGRRKSGAADGEKKHLCGNARALLAAIRRQSADLAQSELEHTKCILLGAGLTLSDLSLLAGLR